MTIGVALVLDVAAVLYACLVKTLITLRVHNLVPGAILIIERLDTQNPTAKVLQDPEVLNLVEMLKQIELGITTIFERT